MAGKVQLTPAQLLAQSQEMLSLQKDYESLFQETSTLLNQINGNWSANLANNFLGKITSAQKGFGHICDMLEQGGNLAAVSANTFESMDSLLSKAMQGDAAAGTLLRTSAGAAAVAGAASAGAASSASGAANGGQGLWSSFLTDWNRAGGALESFREFYESRIPEELREELKKMGKEVFGSQIFSAYDITYDLVTGNVDMDTFYSGAKAVLGGTKGGAVKNAFEYAGEIRDKDAQYTQRSIDELLSGNVLTGLFNMGASFIDEIGTGVVDVGGSMAIGALEKIPGLSKIEEYLDIDLGETWETAMDSFHEGVTNAFTSAADSLSKAEDALQEAVGDGLKAAGEALDKAADAAAEAAKAAGKGIEKAASAVGDGLGRIGDGLKSLF